MSNQPTVVPVERIARTILWIRGQRVILDCDLAELYGVTTARLNQQVRRNLSRFPRDFAFPLVRLEVTNLMLQNAISSRHGGRRKLPWVFTEHGAIMAASVLNSPRAVQVSVYVVRAFLRLKELLAGHKELAEKVAELHQWLATHDVATREIVDAIRRLTALPPPESESEPYPEPEQCRPKIGFRTRESRAPYRRRRTRS